MVFICIAAPSCTGKTTFIKHLTSNEKYNAYFRSYFEITEEIKNVIWNNISKCRKSQCSVIHTDLTITIKKNKIKKRKNIIIEKFSIIICLYTDENTFRKRILKRRDVGVFTNFCVRFVWEEFFGHIEKIQEIKPSIKIYMINCTNKDYKIEKFNKKKILKKMANCPTFKQAYKRCKKIMYSKQ